MRSLEMRRWLQIRLMVSDDAENIRVQTAVIFVEKYLRNMGLDFELVAWYCPVSRKEVKHDKSKADGPDHGHD